MSTSSHCDTVYQVEPSAKGCGWGWCFIDEVAVDLPGQTPQRGPIKRFF